MNTKVKTRKPHSKKVKKPTYVIKTADIYNHIIYMSENIEDIAKYLKVEVSKLIPMLNNNSKIGKYRVGLINLKYAKKEYNLLKKEQANE